MTSLCAVSYLNTKPFLGGLYKEFTPMELSIKLLEPATCAQSFLNNQSDIALIPVGALLDLQQVAILPNYCIGANGKVDSVFIFSEVPIEQVDTLYLDKNSRTSNGLARILFKHYWKKNVTYLQENEHINHIRNQSAGVVIGDRAIALRNNFKYVYDLALEWREWADLPFVFAIWAYNPSKIDKNFINRLSIAFEKGLSDRTKIAAKWASSFEMTVASAFQYLTQSIDYQLDDIKLAAIEVYLKELAIIENLQVPHIQIGTFESS